ncbi:MAG: bifunctional fucokinase/L-fucose-1-P-guanylyltransferase [Clostridia bacterium]|nr:bifunctional fucokinase/L-fucose-1-P-guanylyltransferase [Clostridia bacterium]
MTSLFLSQSYKDTWDDYQRSLSSAVFPVWDYVILTASNENQAEGYRMQIEERKKFLSDRTHFAVVPDEGGERVGSGGATLSVLKYIYEREGRFEGIRTLVIHSGGDSKRVPQYSALGKLFSPVPHKLPDGRASSLFDEFMISMSSVAGRIREGMLLLSGDVLLLFNPLQIDYNNNAAAAISFKEAVETGKNHGVFLGDDEGNVKKFLHKQSVEQLKSQGAVNENGCVDIDTGAVIFSTDILSSLYKLIDTDEGYKKYVNGKVRLSLYGDFLYPLAKDSTLEAFYNEAPEGEMCDELISAREKVWGALNPYKMKLLRLAPAKFIHFGTTKEILALMGGGVNAYSELGWSRKVTSSISGNKAAGYNSVLSEYATIGSNCYLEVTNVHRNSKIGNNVLLSYIDIRGENIPDNVVLHGLKQKDGKFVCRIYGISDNPKSTKLFGTELSETVKKLGIDESELWETDDRSLWNAKLYPVCDGISQAVAEALKLYEMVLGNADAEEWKAKQRKSLCAGFNDADSSAILAWNKRMNELVRMDEIIKDIRSGKRAKNARKLETLTVIQREWLEKKLGEVDFSEGMRLHYYIGSALVGVEGEQQIAECFKMISRKILEATLENLKYNDKIRIITDKHTVELPLRVNFGGGWSDTPPYCIEHGGTVLNAAIKLNGECPVAVTLERIDEKKIVFDSRDMDVHGEFDTIEPLQRTGDPYDSFALQKACLLACGIIPKEGGNLEEILTRIGGGFVMHSEVTNVPKGSGLGTSSILSAACVKAMFEFMGIPFEEKDLFSHVLAMEQIMSTGGGWQDQVGGVVNGIKYITSNPGMNQKLEVQKVSLNENVMKELNDRFCLIYTGQRRLARNLLRDVVGRYVGNEPESLYALNEIQKVAALMRFELERGNIDEFARLLDYHWELSKQIDEGSSNTLIDQIFRSVDEFIDGRLVCGAGGGGFLQVILKKGIRKEDVHVRLKEVFQDNPVDVWDCELI